MKRSLVVLVALAMVLACSDQALRAQPADDQLAAVTGATPKSSPAPAAAPSPAPTPKATPTPSPTAKAPAAAQKAAAAPASTPPKTSSKTPSVSTQPSSAKQAPAQAPSASTPNSVTRATSARPYSSQVYTPSNVTPSSPANQTPGPNTGATPKKPTTASMPASHPASMPASRPASMPWKHPTSVPASRPASMPSSMPSDPGPFIRGRIVSVSAAGTSLTVESFGRMFNVLATDTTKITLNAKPSAVTDLKAGMFVGVRWEKGVALSIRAMSPVDRPLVGKIVSVSDSGLTLTADGKEMNVSAGSDTIVIIDGKMANLEELTAGMLVAVQPPTGPAEQIRAISINPATRPGKRER